MVLHTVIMRSLLIVGLVGGALCGDCGPCVCLDDDIGRITVNCAARDLTSIPDDLPASITFIEFSGNRLAPENLNGLCEYALVNVNLSGNHLTSLSSHQFDRCYITGQIDFSENIFESISETSLAGLRDVEVVHNLESRDFLPQALSALTQLRELSVIFHQSTLSNDQFSGLSQVHTLTVDIRNAFNIPQNLFRPMSTSLIKLTIITKSLPFIGDDILKDCSLLDTFELLTHNLHSIPAVLFNSSPALTRICMRGIGSLPRHVFTNLEQLTTLELHDVEDMSSDVFVGLLGLKNLDLSECSISKIQPEWFKDLLSLERLNLAKIGLQSLTSDDFIGLSSLVELDLSENQLRTLDQFSFSTISDTIKHIGLSKNNLKTVSDGIFGDLKNLETLDLCSNQIHSISTGAFTSLLRLKELNLHDNKIYSLPEGIFDQNGELEILDLSSNVISESLPSASERLHSLRVLNISDNRLVSVTDLQNSLNPFIKAVDLSLNQLKCECVSQELIKVLEDIKVIGTCYDPGSEEVDLTTYLKSDRCVLESSTVSTLSTSTTLSPTSVMTKSTLSVSEQKELSVTESHKDDSHLPIVDSDDGPTDTVSRENNTDKIYLIHSSTTSTGQTVEDIANSGYNAAHNIDNQYMSSTGTQSTISSIVTTSSTSFNGTPSNMSTTGTSSTIDTPSTLSSTNSPPTTKLTSHTTATTVTTPTTPYETIPSKTQPIKPRQYSVISSTTSSPEDTGEQVGHPYGFGSNEEPGLSEAALGFDEAETSNDSYYIAVACISAVSLACILVLIYLWVRHSRRQQGYEVSNIEDHAIDSFIRRTPGAGSTGSTNGPILLRETPSIQIDTIDNENRRQVIEYPVSDSRV